MATAKYRSIVWGVDLTFEFSVLPRDITRTVWGVDLVEEHLLASCGLPARPLIARKPLARLAEYSINAPVTGGWRSKATAATAAPTGV